jgi:MFS family permease
VGALIENSQHRPSLLGHSAGAALPKMSKEIRPQSAASQSSSSIKDVENQSTLQAVDAKLEEKIDEQAEKEKDADALHPVEPKAMEDIENAPRLPPPPSGPLAIDPSEFPDGGIKAWTVVLGSFCCLFVSFGWINCIGVFQDYYQTHLLRNYSPSTISWISSLEACQMFLWGPVVGKIYDNYGPREILLAGSFLHVFGLMMTSLATKYYQFVLAQGICSPIGASMIFYPAMSSVTTWFFGRRAFAIGIVASGSSLGGVIFPIMTERLIPQVGFPWTMRICAFFVLFMMVNTCCERSLKFYALTIYQVIANVTVRSRIPPHPKPLRLKEFVKPLREVPFFLLTLGMFLTFLALFLPFNFIIVQASTIGMSNELAGYLVPILNAVR